MRVAGRCNKLLGATTYTYFRIANGDRRNWAWQRDRIEVYTVYIYNM